MKTNRYIIATICMLLVASCAKNRDATSSQESHDAHEEHSDELLLSEVQMKAVDIRLGKIEQKELSDVVRANGTLVLAPQNRAEVTSLAGGVVSRINVRESQAVGKGQTVALIENTEVVEIQKNYLTSQKRTELTEQEYARQKSLNAQGAGVEKTLQQAKADYEISHAESSGLQQQLRQLSIDPAQVERGNISRYIAVKAPISGIVNRINVCTGSYADMQSPLMSIADNSALYCSLNVFESDISKVHAGQNVDIVLTNGGNVRITGKVAEVNSYIDEKTKTVPVHVSISDKKITQLMAGMYVSATIEVGLHKSDALPDGAIAAMDGRSYVFMLEAKEKNDTAYAYRFERKEVFAGVSRGGYTQVSFAQPLRAGSEFVVRNAFYLASMAGDHGEH